MSDTRRIAKNVASLSHILCVGCRSCEQSCPKQCINMQADTEGFLFPKISDDCIECGSCVRHCPVLSPQKNTDFVAERYAMILKNKNVLSKSSSGGAFGGIADYILHNGGVVFGAAFDEKLCVKQTAVHSPEKLHIVQGSKYVSCSTEHSFSDVKRLLENEKTVLYGGSPCQIAGLKAFLGKSYENLFTMDLICHGVPSEKLFQKYLEWLGKKTKGKVIYYGFRDKDIAGWSCGGKTLVKTKTKTKVIDGICDPYYSAFLRCESYRESCYRCPFARSENRIGDITMGDFWGTDKTYPEISGKDGISFCTINSEQGKKVFDLIKNDFDIFPVPGDECLRVNVAYNHASLRPSVRNSIYDGIDGDLNQFFKKFKYEKYPIFLIKKCIHRFCPASLKKILKRLLRRGV
ncbi:MAG: Coenzyme F420 hydrogenase/dehydrogenase, beta subunit C-terminal domain [Treponema sp.]|nr:Coenzyme F420 hydrogenase/dehydrogenase, beta subunit C-terminal domain [Treponema sp.]